MAKVESQLLNRDDALTNAKKELARAQQRMKKYYDQHHREVTFEPDEYVYLKIDPRKQKALRKRYDFKLARKFFGPFKVLQRIGKVAYRLELPTASQLHPVFHISWLKKHIGDPTQVSRDIPTMDEEGQLVLQPFKALDYLQVK